MTSARATRRKTKIILSALGCEAGELSLLLTDDDEIRDLNRAWLGRDRPTDVLAWSQREGPPAPAPLLGDVVISIPAAARQAKEYHLSLDQELNRLLCHGILHLFGHDHVKGGEPARKMKSLTERLLAELARSGEV